MRNVLIVAKIGSLQDGLQALLTTQPNIDAVTIVDSLETADVYILEGCPILILAVIDSLDKNQKEILTNFRNHCAQTRVLILVDNEDVYQAVLSYEMSAVFNKGIKINELSQIIESILKV